MTSHPQLVIPTHLMPWCLPTLPCSAELYSAHAGVQCSVYHGVYQQLLTGGNNCMTSLTQHELPRALALRGLVKVKKNNKNSREKLGLAWHHPHIYPYSLFFVNMYNNKNTQQTQHFNKKNPSWGLTPPPPHTPPTCEFFSAFWIFLTWQNPLPLARFTIPGMTQDAV